MGSYIDRDKPFNLYQNMKSMLDSSYYLREDGSGGIYQHVLDYPDAKVPGATDFFYWEDIDFSQGPAIRVNHVSMFPQGFGAAKYVVTNKQLYASHHIRMALQVFYCVPDTQNPDKPGFYLIEMNDSRILDSGVSSGFTRSASCHRCLRLAISFRRPISPSGWSFLSRRNPCRRS